MRNCHLRRETELEEAEREERERMAEQTGAAPKVENLTLSAFLPSMAHGQFIQSEVSKYRYG